MTVKECYECLGADYEDVSCRLRSEERILKFLKMVLKDTSFKDLCNAMEEQDYEKAISCRSYAERGIAEPGIDRTGKICGGSHGSAARQTGK